MGSCSLKLHNVKLDKIRFFLGHLIKSHELKITYKNNSSHCQKSTTHEFKFDSVTIVLIYGTHYYTTLTLTHYTHYTTYKST